MFAPVFRLLFFFILVQQGMAPRGMASIERQSIEADFEPPFTVMAPRGAPSPFVLCSPHSGRTYPARFLRQSRLDPLTLRKSEDFYVDELFSAATHLGAPLLAANFPRAYLDVNREPYELDPELFDDALPDYANTQSMRVIGGLGTLARIVADGEEIYDRPLKLSEALERIERLYRPFHDALSDLVGETHRRFGYAVLIDCHSMPSAQGSGPSGAAPRPQFVLGDRFGHACDPRLSRAVRDAIAGRGYDVQMNRPYAGGYITEHYGRPGRGVHALQIEVNRGLYMDEQRIVTSPDFGRVKDDVTEILTQVFAKVPPLLEMRSAAE